ncbi:MAG: hypothetical protein LBU32_23320 [Clostridiales bacterium]|jgi:hypothetical protein|nr:hypothetical protein [Clostridiales bacterium]
MQILLSLNDVVYAALLALVFTWIILGLGGIVRSALSKPSNLDYRPKDMSKILAKCYHLFPEEKILFHGETFTRGMKVRVTTSQHKIFEGQLIGLNNDKMLCVLTSRYIVAHELDKIVEMNILC